MQKLSVAFLLLALCTVSYGYGHGYAGRQLKDAFASGSSSSKSKDGGSASSGVSIVSRGGRATGSASADSRSFSKAKSQLIIYCQRVYNEVKFPTYRGGSKDKYCLSVYSEIDDYVIAYGKASASAFAGTTSSITISGRGRGCAYSAAQARSHAAAYSRIVVQAVAEANIGPHSAKAKASADIVSAALAQAFATSRTTACAADNSFARAYQTSHAKAVGYPVATLWIWLFAGVDCRNQREFSKVSASGESRVETTTSVDSSGGTDTGSSGVATAEGDGGAAVTEPCAFHSTLNVCCRRHNLRRGVCKCRGRCNAHLVKNFRRTWFDKKTKKGCHC